MANVAQPYGKAHRCEVARRMPNPRIGSPVGNQACIVPRLLCDLLLLKLPHPELRQQVLTAYLQSNFLKSVLILPRIEV